MAHGALQAAACTAGHRQSDRRDPVLHPFHQRLFARAAAPHDPRRGARRVPRHRGERAGGPADHRVLRHLARVVPGRRRHAAADLVAADAERGAGRKPQVRPRRGRRQGRRRRQHRGRPADDPVADRSGDDLDDGHLRREDAPLVGARRPGRLRRRDRTLGLDRLQPVGAHRQGHRQDRHQRDDAADGPAARGARGRGDVGRPRQAVPGARSAMSAER